jgi:hypothetical protein
MNARPAMIIPEVSAAGEHVASPISIPTCKLEILTIDEGPVPFTINVETPETPSWPAKILLGWLNDPRLRLRKAIQIDLSRHEQTIIAYSPGFEEFGYGANISEALDDIAGTLSELFFSLGAHKDHLSKDLDCLRTLISEYVVDESARV